MSNLRNIIYSRTQKIFGIDFDGTIVKDMLLNGGSIYDLGETFPYAVEAMQGLRDNGHKILFWTCRGSKTLYVIYKWIAKENFWPDIINHNLIKFDPAPSAQKVYADFYLDNRSFPPFNPNIHWKIIYEAYKGE